MKLSEYIKRISEEQNHLYDERKKMISKHKEDLKEIDKQIEDKKILISILISHSKANKELSIKYFLVQ